MTESELLLLLLQKNENAFKYLVVQFKDRVYNTSVGFVQNEKDAEDISQEIFIQIYKSIGQFKGNSTLNTWIYRITVSKCLDFLRSKKRKKRFGFVTNFFNNEVEANENSIEYIHAGIRMEQKENAKILMQKINELPENQRTAFLLNKIENLNYKEISEIMQTTERAVDSLLQRAKQNLRKKLST